MMKQKTVCMRWGSLLFLIVLCTACGPDVEVVKEDQTEYQVYWDEEKRDFVRHGYFKAFYESGKIKAAGEYDHSYRRGIWTQWYENGQ
ncbi:MAG: hypothetical protein HOE48_07795, partial [Candidatus Latescibacteria bacterium]|nr:hypothetical protein [Candidatus Latescibacterota bacterium]